MDAQGHQGNHQNGIHLGAQEWYMAQAQKPRKPYGEQQDNCELPRLARFH